MVPAENIVMGLRERRTELAEQLARLEAARERVEADLDAVDRTIQVVGGQRVPAPEPVPESALDGPVRRRRGLAEAVRAALGDCGPMTAADVVIALGGDECPWPSSSVASTLSTLRKSGDVTSCPTAIGGRVQMYALVEGGAA